METETGETEREERILLQNDLPLLDPPGCKQSPSFAGKVSDGEGRTGMLVVPPVIDLTLLGTIGSFLTNTSLQASLGVNFTEVTSGHF